MGLIFSAGLGAAEEKTSAPASVEGDRKETLPRQGTAIRYGMHAGPIGLYKVCDVGFYAAEKTVYQTLLTGNAACAISYTYVRDIAKSDYVPRWQKKLLDGGLAREKAVALVALLPQSGIKTGDALQLLWYPAKTFIVRYNGKESGRLTDDETARAVLAGLLGPDGPWGVPESILGARPKNASANSAKPVR